MEHADILIENNAPGHLDSLGLGYETLHSINPRLILTSITPFGQSGPYRNWKGTDLIEWVMSLTGYNTPTLVDDAEEENPLRAPCHAAERMGATTAAASPMMPLFRADATRPSQWMDAPCPPTVRISRRARPSRKSTIRWRAASSTRSTWSR